MIAPFPLKQSGTDANVQVRGVSPAVFEVRSNAKMYAGRFFQPGLNELVVGRNVVSSYNGLGLGQTVRFGGGNIGPWWASSMPEAAPSIPKFGAMPRCWIRCISARPICCSR